jgi:pimeloyl-ACP methyl ester carboxylesterase
LLLDCLDLIGVDDATVIVNDTAGGLLLLSLATDHPALGRIDRLVLTNCDSYDQFPPDALKKATALSRTLPRLARTLMRLQLRSSFARRRVVSSVTATGLDHEREESFFGPLRGDRRVVDDLVAASATFRPQLLLDAAEAIPRFDRPVLLIWGDSCDFFPMAHARRLASDFPRATLIPVPGAKTWVPVDDPVVLADAIMSFVPTTVP